MRRHLRPAELDALAVSGMKEMRKLRELLLAKGQPPALAEAVACGVVALMLGLRDDLGVGLSAETMEAIANAMVWEAFGHAAGCPDHECKCRTMRPGVRAPEHMA